MALWSLLVALATFASPVIYMLQASGAGVADEAWLGVAAVAAAGAAGLIRTPQRRPGTGALYDAARKESRD